MEDLHTKAADIENQEPGLKEKTSDLADHVEDLATSYFQLAVVKATQKATLFGSTMLVLVAACIFGFFTILFAGLALSWWLGNLVEDRALGFLMGGGFFLLILAVVMLLRKQIIFPYFRDLIIRKIYEKKD